MRISTDKGDPGYCAWIPQPISFLLDGVECTRATMVDEERGEILRGKENEHGELYTVDGRFVTETVRGKVEVILPDGVSRDPHHWVKPLWARVSSYLLRRWLRGQRFGLRIPGATYD